jgi:hypothetical protein
MHVKRFKSYYKLCIATQVHHICRLTVRFQRLEKSEVKLPKSRPHPKEARAQDTGTDATTKNA